MATNSDIGAGTKFKRSPDGVQATEKVEVADVTSVNGVSLSKEMIQDTPLNTNDRYHSYFGGMKDGNTVTVGLAFDPDSQGYQHALADFELKDNGFYAIEFLDGSVWEFEGGLQEINPDTPMEGKMMLELVYKVSGKPTFTAGT